MDTVVHRHGHVIVQILLTEYILLFSFQQHTTIQQLFTSESHQSSIQIKIWLYTLTHVMEIASNMAYFRHHIFFYLDTGPVFIWSDLSQEHLNTKSLRFRTLA